MFIHNLFNHKEQEAHPANSFSTVSNIIEATITLYLLKGVFNSVSFNFAVASFKVKSLSGASNHHVVHICIAHVVCVVHIAHIVHVVLVVVNNLITAYDIIMKTTVASGAKLAVP